jgi:hypothetical protein
MKKVLIALECNSMSPKEVKGDSAESFSRIARIKHGNRIVKGSQERKWLEKYCHGKCYGRSFTSYLDACCHPSCQAKKINVLVVLKQGFSNQVFL